MKKGIKIFIQILETILVIPLGILGAICLIPFMALMLLFALPFGLVEDVWEVDMADKYKEEK